jgi:hypothetical protein
MKLENDYWTGSINEIIETLIRGIGQYTRHYSHVKIGITNNPSRRFQEHSRSGDNWKRMIIKYKTSSINFIKQIETILIDNHWDYVRNKVGGGGGREGMKPYYLYVLVK